MITKKAKQRKQEKLLHKVCAGEITGYNRHITVKEIAIASLEASLRVLVRNLGLRDKEVTKNNLYSKNIISLLKILYGKVDPSVHKLPKYLLVYSYYLDSRFFKTPEHMDVLKVLIEKLYGKDCML